MIHCPPRQARELHQLGGDVCLIGSQNEGIGSSLHLDVLDVHPFRHYEDTPTHTHTLHAASELSELSITQQLRQHPRFQTRPRFHTCNGGEVQEAALR